MVFSHFHISLILLLPRYIKSHIRLQLNYDNYHIQSLQFLSNNLIIFIKNFLFLSFLNIITLKKIIYMSWNRSSVVFQTKLAFKSPTPGVNIMIIFNILNFKLHVKAKVCVSPQLTYNTFLFCNLVISLGIYSKTTPPCPKDPYSPIP